MLKIVLLQILLYLTSSSLIFQNIFNFPNDFYYNTFSPLQYGHFFGYGLSTSDGVRSFFSKQFDSFGNKIRTQIMTSGMKDLFDLSDCVRSRTNKNSENYLKVWQQKNTSTDQQSFYGMVFDSNARNSTTAFWIASSCNNTAYYTNLKGNNFVLVWISTCLNQTLLLAQIFNSSGSLIGPEIQILRYNFSASLYQADVNPLSDGRFVVVYEAKYENSDRTAIFARIYNGDGESYKPASKLFDGIRNNDSCNSASLTSSAAHLQVFGLSDQKFLVIYRSDEKNLSFFTYDNEMLEIQNFTIQSPNSDWLYNNFSAASLIDPSTETIAVIGCCIKKSDLWYIRINGSGVIEYSNVGVNMSRREGYFFTYLEHINNGLLVYEAFDENKPGLYPQRALIIKFMNDSAINLISHFNQSENKIAENNVKNDNRIVLGVFLSITILVVLLSAGLLYRRFQKKRAIKYAQAENKEGSSYDKRNDENNFF